MNLTESQLFTIEALNRIEGFVWPECSEFAGLGCNTAYMAFWASVPIAGDKNFRAFLDEVYVGTEHPDWRNSLITREQFDSVDGWVRNDGKPRVGDVFVDVMFDSGDISHCECVDELDWADSDVAKWRYHKPTKENEIKDAEAFQPTIHETYYRYKKQRENTADARKALEASMEAEDKLLEQIKAWNLEYGFDIRVLDESDEVPEVESELVITDWRDLRIGDVVWWSGAGCIDSGEYVVSNVESSDYKGSTAFCVSCAHGLEWVSTKFEKWKFIRRPSK